MTLPCCSFHSPRPARQAALSLNPAGFEVPRTDFDQKQAQQQHQDRGADREALEEVQWPLSIALAVAGAAAGIVAAALLSVHLAKRYDVQQMEQQWRRRAKEERRRRKWLQGKRIPELEARCSQLERWLGALRTCQRLDRWLPPPLVAGRQRWLERWRTDVRVRQLDAELAGHQLQLACCKLEVAVGSDADHPHRWHDASGSEGGTATEGCSGGSKSGSGDAKEAASDGKVAKEAATGSGGEPAQPPSGQRKQEALVHGRRHNLAAPLVRAVHSLLRGAR